MFNQWMRGKVVLTFCLFSSVAFAQPSTLSELVQEALLHNDNLKAKNFELAAAEHALQAAKHSLKPSVSVSARYTAADGGRTIEFPIGDALNPAYQNLNRLNAGAGINQTYPLLDNVQFDLLREREQDTRISVQGPLYAPEIAAAIRAAQAGVLQKQAAREVFARTLVKEVQLAYYQLGQARAQRKTLQASARVLDENLRVNEALVRAGTSTRDRSLRAKTEVLAIEDRLQSARDQERNARRYLNYLVGRKLTARFGAVELPAVRIIDNDAKATQRAELRELSAAIDAADASAQAQRARLKPSIVYAIDGGIQGENYGFGRGKNFASASVVLNWRLFDFGAAKARAGSFSEQARANQANLLQLRSAFRLTALQAKAEYKTATARTETAQARLNAAEESYRISAKKRDAGALTQIEYLDAERARTEASLALDAARFDLARRYVEWEFATASFALPAAILQGP